MNDRLLFRAVVACVALAVLWLGAGCRQDAGASAQATSTTASVQRTNEQAESAMRVERVVFIGKRHACDCTRRRIDESFSALEAALDGRDDIEVLRLQADVDETLVGTYGEMRAMMVLPAIYFLNGSGELIDMLQGEVTDAQIAAVLERNP